MNESCTKGGEDQVVALLQLILVFPDSQRYRSGTRVSVAFDVYHHLLHWQLQALGYCLDDTHVSLMRNHPLDVVLVQTVGLITRNASVAHEYAQMAVDADPECYEGLFELATDYALGDRRTGKEGTTDVVKANELFSKGLNLAKKNHDEDYIFVFTKRHEETDRFLQLSAEE